MQEARSCKLLRTVIRLGLFTVFSVVAIFFMGMGLAHRADALAPDDLSFVIIPDTQNESREIIDSICDWILLNRSERNIQAVISVGDLTDNATHSDFQRVAPCYNRLNNSGLVNLPIVGNHDYDKNIPANRGVTTFETYFGPGYFAGKSWFGGSYNNSTANYYVKLTHNTRKFLILALEFFPRPEAVNWASGIIDQNPDYEVIITTHGYLDPDGTRTLDTDPWGPNTYSLPAVDSSGEDLWNNLVRKKANIRFVVSGHQVSGNMSMRSDPGDFGNIVYQVFNNWQEELNGGDGWIGLLQLKTSTANADITYIRTWNPPPPTFNLASWPLVTPVTPTPGLTATSTPTPGLTATSTPTPGLTATSTPTSNSWYNGAWNYRKVVAINQTKVAASLTNFPLLISVTDTDLKSVESGGKVGSNQGFDFVFTDVGNIRLDHEIERYDPATGNLVAWVRVPALSPSTPTILNLYFGNSAAPNQQSAVAVWDNNYMAVWHLKETVDQHQDSTRNVNNSTNVVVGSQGLNGLIGGADLFSASSHYIGIPASSTSLKKAFTSISVSAWINPTAHLAGTYGPTVIANTDGDGWALRINNGQIMADLRLTGGNILQQFGAQLPLNGWSYVSYSYDGTKVTAFVNGVQVGTTAASGSIKTVSNKSTCTLIGNDPSGCVTQGTQYPFKGRIDEVRVSDNARSSAWTLTEYNNQSNPAEFTTLSTTESKP